MRDNIVTFERSAPTSRAETNCTGEAAMIDFVVERLLRDEAKAMNERRVLDTLAMIAVAAS